MVNLKIPPEKAIFLLNEKIVAIQKMQENPQGCAYYDFVGFCSKVWSVIDEIYPADERHPEEIRIIELPTCSCNATSEIQLMLLDIYQSRLQEYVREIQNGVK